MRNKIVTGLTILSLGLLISNQTYSQESSSLDSLKKEIKSINQQSNELNEKNNQIAELNLKNAKELNERLNLKYNSDSIKINKSENKQIYEDFKIFLEKRKENKSYETRKEYEFVINNDKIIINMYTNLLSVEKDYEIDSAIVFRDNNINGLDNADKIGKYNYKIETNSEYKAKQFKTFNETEKLKLKKEYNNILAEIMSKYK